MKSKKLSPLAVYLVCAAAIVLLLAADQYTKSLILQKSECHTAVFQIKQLQNPWNELDRRLVLQILHCQ